MYTCMLKTLHKLTHSLLLRNKHKITFRYHKLKVSTERQ